MTNVKMSFELLPKQLPNYEKCENWIGFQKIEIIEYNYDNKGNALLYEDGDLSYFSPDALNFLMFSGWYKEIIKIDETLLPF